MQIAARNGSIAMLALIRQHGGSLDSRGPKGDGLFHLAAYNGHLDTMRWLQNNGIDTAAVDSSGQSAGHLAAKRGEPRILLYLRDEINADFSLMDHAGQCFADCIPRYAEDEERKVKLEYCRKIATSAVAKNVKRAKKGDEIAIMQLEEENGPINLHNNNSNAIFLDTS